MKMMILYPITRVRNYGFFIELLIGDFYERINLYKNSQQKSF